MSFDCDECESTFISKKNLDTHIINIHSNIKDLNCHVCNKMFYTEVFINRHYKTKHPDTKRIFKCIDCEIDLAANKNLNKHIRDIHNYIKNIKCHICDKLFYTETFATRHYANKHPNIQRIFECIDCEIDFVANKSLNAHITNIHNLEKNIECHVCNKMFYKEVYINDHYLKKHPDIKRKFECFECEITFVSKVNLNNHIKAVHNNIKDLGCHVCNKMFYTEVYINDHYLKNHPNIKRIFECLECETTYEDKRQLNAHISTFHIGEKNLKCYICDKMFYTQSFINNHFKDKHPTVKQFICDFKDCGKSYIHNKKLTMHKKIHDKSTYIKCDFEGCDYLTPYSTDLKKHKMQKHNVDVLWIQCLEENCNSEFKTKSDLNSHLEKVHDIGKYQCDLCLQNRNSHNEWVDHLKNKVKICRGCYNKCTGKNSSKEKQMADYLDNIIEISPFLVAKNKSFKSLGGCGKKRPDVLYVSHEIAIWLECDEFQHTNSSSYICDEKRISDAYDEFNNMKLIVIRFNPDTYKPPKNIKKLNRKERLTALKELILKVLKAQPDELIKIYYMFYDEDNDLISKNIPYELIY